MPGLSTRAEPSHESGCAPGRARVASESTQRMLPRKVDVDGETYECARHYMIRLLRSDFESSEKLAKLAGIVNMNPDQFVKRFGYLVGLSQ